MNLNTAIKKLIEKSDINDWYLEEGYDYTDLVLKNKGLRFEFFYSVIENEEKETMDILEEIFFTENCIEQKIEGKTFDFVKEFKKKVKQNQFHVAIKEALK
jgi:hypothetical protein